ncbi:hypothetical protein Anapl_17100 [Anas platyrhynchos]|uniref:Uncharacterized protein n=1 Tax=Anas platyrhynchos TaxID=8839 RepID=R0L384_ANAPL|nr:hypothetical protein Anapl_17100 [Anas platyrhynchos]
MGNSTVKSFEPFSYKADRREKIQTVGTFSRTINSTQLHLASTDQALNSKVLPIPHRAQNSHRIAKTSEKDRLEKDAIKVSSNVTENDNTAAVSSLSSVTKMASVGKMRFHTAFNLQLICTLLVSAQSYHPCATSSPNHAGAHEDLFPVPAEAKRAAARNVLAALLLPMVPVATQ